MGRVQPDIQVVRPGAITGEVRTGPVIDRNRMVRDNELSGRVRSIRDLSDTLRPRGAIHLLHPLKQNKRRVFVVALGALYPRKRPFAALPRNDAKGQ